MASNPGQIPAGGKDHISVAVSTKNRGGETLHKGFTVYTNDPGVPQMRLEVTGKVNGYLTVAPTFVRLIGRVDQSLTQKVTITPQAGYPFTIKSVKAQKGENLHTKLTPLGPDPSKAGYELMVENTLHKAGNYRDLITLKTSSKEKPTINIPVFAHIHAVAKENQQKTN